MKKIEERFSGKALVVDDYPLNLELVQMMLEIMGVEVDTALSGDEALNLCKNRSYDIIFMDIQMPVKNGVETTREIRQYQKKHIPVVALTAHALVGDREEYLSQGLDDYISKPITGRALSMILQKYLAADS